ncbi:MAG: exodeoxyribonuclease VII large subunit [Actinomycetota bacterium]
MNALIPGPLIPNSALSVSELTAYIAALLEDNDFLQQVWAIGEVSSASTHSKGIFFTLKDSEKTASIRCIIWNSYRPQLVQPPVQGEQLIVLGSLRVYQGRGEYQLSVYQAFPAGEGLQALRYKQLRSRLAAEGLFQPERKQKLPIHPQTVAVVTSPNAAAWGDIQRTLSSRYPGLHVLLSTATVQGDSAPDSIVAGIERVESDGRAEAIILARGGGAVEDLACFDDERVVRAVANCSIPIITGIGHERDESLADLAADACAHTPTAAAELAVPDLNLLYQQHRQRVQVLIEALEERLSQAEARLLLLNNRLKSLPETSRRLQQATNQCQLLQQKLTAIDPKAVLKRGYAVVKRKNGTIVRTATDVVVGEELTIRLEQGEIKVRAIESGSS